MDQAQRIKTLQFLPFFQDLTTPEIKLLSEIIHEKTFNHEEIIIEQGTPASEAYIIISGSAKVYIISEDGEEINLGIVAAPELIGEMALLDNQPRSANVEAIQQTQTLVISGSEFKKLLLTHPETTLGLLKTLSLRVRKADERLEDFMSKNLIERTWKVLLILAQFYPNQEITLSQEELSHIVSATRARITEVLNILESQNKITLSHRKIKLL